jgi:hypothetical protein
MPAATSPIFPNVPIIGIASLVSNTAVTSRAVISGTTGLTQLTATSTNGTRIDFIEVVAQGNSVATSQCIWIYNGSNSYLYDEIAISAVTANTITPATSNSVTYTTLVLPPTYQLYTSQTVSSNVSVFAFGGQY